MRYDTTPTHPAGERFLPDIQITNSTAVVMEPNMDIKAELSYRQGEASKRSNRRPFELQRFGIGFRVSRHSELARRPTLLEHVTGTRVVVSDICVGGYVARILFNQPPSPWSEIQPVSSQLLFRTHLSTFANDPCVRRLSIFYHNKH